MPDLLPPLTTDQKKSNKKQQSGLLANNELCAGQVSIPNMLPCSWHLYKIKVIANAASSCTVHLFAKRHFRCNGAALSYTFSNLFN